jgi:predicted MFS family arabinose efflux permease
MVLCSDHGRSVSGGRPAFARLWFGQTTSVFGTAISALALPTVAILGMHAPAFLVGVLEAAQFAAYPVLGLAAGVWVDRWSRRATMLVADVVRALALGTVPLAAAWHLLTLAQLVAVALVVGAASVFFDVAYQAFVPSLVETDWLEHANARLEATREAAMMAGAGLAGALISAVGAPLAVVVDGATYVVSIVSLAGIRVREAHRDALEHAPPPAFRAALVDGLRVVFGSPVLRAIAGSTGCVNLGWSIISAVWLLYFYRILHFSPLLAGAIIACGNLGFIGALAAPALLRRIPAGRLMIGTLLATVAVTFAIPLASILNPIAVMIPIQLCAAFCIPCYNVTQISLRQRLVPPEQLGRMSATMKTLVWGVMPIGALIGGALGSTIGIVPTIWVGAIVMLSAIPWLFAREVRTLPRSSWATAYATGEGD